MIRRIVVSTAIVLATSLAGCTCGGNEVTVTERHLRFTVQPQDALAGAALNPEVEVAIQDQAGNLLTEETAEVSLALGTNSGGATLSGTTTVAAVGGVARFAGLSLEKAAAGYTLRATAASIGPGTSAAFAIRPAAAAAMAFTTGPSEAISDGLISPAVQLTVSDAYGNLVDTFADPVTVSLAVNPASGTLSGTTTVNAAAGVATFSELSIDLAADGYELGASSTGALSARSSPFRVKPGQPKTLAFQQQPSNATAGQAIAPAVTVRVLDSRGNLVTDFAGSVDLALASGPGALQGTLQATATGGIATFSDLAITLAASGYALEATSGTLTPAQSAAFVIAPGPAASFTVSGIGSPIVAGTAATVTVTALDAYGNVATGYTGTVSLGSSDSSATLPASYAFTAGDAGSHTFPVTLVTAGSQSVNATDGASSLSGAQSAIAVEPAAAASLSVAGHPSPSTAGTLASVTVTARDAYGNVATGHSATVTLSSSDGQAVLGAPAALASGTGTFAVTLKTSGTQSITASDGSLNGAQNAIAVNPAAAASLTASGYPSPITAGTSGSLGVVARDAYGNLATGYTGTVAVTSSDPQAVLPASATLTNGSGSFAVELRTAGTQSLQASDGSLSSTQSNITVTPAAAAALVASGYPSPITAGTAADLTVTARDAFGNVATGYAGTVTVTSSDTNAVLPAPAALASGVGTFNATLRTTGQQSLTAADGTFTGSQSGITVTTAVDRFVVAGFPSPIGAGTAGTVTVTAYDAFNNVVTDYAGSVVITSTDGKATLPASGPLTSGTGTFQVTLKTAGAQDLTATDSANATITGTQAAIDVTPGPAARFALSGFPSSIVAGTSANLTVTAFDAYDNLATGYAGTVSVTSTDGKAIEPASATLTSGVGTFAVELRTAGLQTLTASDGAITSTQPDVAVAPAAAASLIADGYPGSVTAGDTGTLTVTAYDPFGNVATGHAAPVAITSSDAQAIRPAAAALTNGVGSFAVELRTAGLQSLTASDGTLSGTQANITVNPGPAASLAASGFPSPITAGTSGDLRVTAYDAFGNVATGYASAVTITSSDGAATVSGGPLVLGTALFPATLKTSGPQSLTASDGTLSGTQSNIAVQAAAAASLVAQGYPSPVTAGASGTLTVTAYDAFNNVAVGHSAPISITSTDPGAVLPLPAALTNGVGAFAVELREAGLQSLTASDGALSSTQPDIQVDAGPAAALVAGGYPDSVTAGSSADLTVTAFDAFGNVAVGYAGTVTIASSDPAAVLPPSSTLTSGVGTFAVELRTAGTWALSADDGALPTATQSPIAVNPGDAVSLIASGYPASVVAGSTADLRVTAYDAFGNVATGHSATVTITSSDAAAVLAGPAALSSGVGDFSASLRTAGVQSLTADDGLLSSTQGGITVEAGPAATLTAAGYPDAVTAGSSGTLTVTAWDAFGNVAVSHATPVSVTATDSQAGLPAPALLSAGVGSFAIELRTAGLQDLTASDGTLSATQADIAVNAGPAASLTATGYPSPIVAGTSGELSVSAFDAFGNPATSYAGTITLTSSDAQASLSSGPLLLGTALFPATLRTSGLQSLTASDGTLSASQANIAVQAGAPASLVASGFPSPITAGTTGSLTVTAYDAFNNVAVGHSGAVSVTSSDGKAILPSAAALTSGVGSFAVELRTADVQSLTATDGTRSSTQANIVVNPGTATSLTAVGYPSPVTAGGSGNLTVTAYDAFLNVATGHTATVTVTSSDGNAVLPAGAALSSGVGSFLVGLRTAGTQSLTASDGALSATQSGIVVDAGPAASLVASGYPAAVVAGSPANLTVTAYDAFNNVAVGYAGTVNVTASDTKAVLPAGAALTNGVGSFAVELRSAGVQSLTASDGTLTSTQPNITVSAGAAASLLAAGYPSAVTAGSAATLTVTAYDAFANVATGHSAPVTITSDDGNAALPPAAALSAGTGSFAVTLRTAGVRSLTASDGTLSSTQGNIAVSAGPAASLVASGYPSPVTAGSSANLTVTAFDAFNNVATSHSALVAITSDDAQAGLPAPAALTNGVGSFLVSLRTAGVRSLTASDGTLTSTQANITVDAGAATSLVASGYPSSVTAGTSHPLNVTAFDAWGNVAVGHSALVAITSTDGNAGLPAAAALTAGTGAFAVELRTEGTWSLTASDGALTSTQSNIAVNPAAPASLVASGFPSPIAAGTSGTLTVTAYDAFGNVASGHTGTVAVTSSDSKAVLPAAAALTAGVGSFTVELRTSGLQSLTASDGTFSSTQNAIQVDAGPVATLEAGGYPDPITAGVSGNLTVTARDAFGNVATSYGLPVSITSSDSQAVLPAPATLTNGVGTFAVTLKTTGDQSLTASDGPRSASQTQITVTTAIDRLVASGFPDPIQAGTAGTITVTAYDTFNNVVTTYGGTVQITSDDPQAVLPASATLTNGVGTFAVTLKTAGERSITAQDTVAPTLTSTQTAITVTPAPAASLVASGYPSPITAGTSASLTVTARDAFGNVATGYGSSVSISSSDGKAILPAAATLTNGVGTFAVELRTAGLQSLTASDGTLSGSQSNITVDAGTATSLVASGYPSPTTAGGSGTLTVTAYDAFLNVATGFGATVTVTSDDPAATVAAPAALTNGVGTFAATLRTSGSRSLTASGGALSGTQTPIAVDPAATSQFVVAGYTSPSDAGVARTFTVSAQDPFGNPTPAYVGTVQFQSSSANRTLPASYTFVAGDAGVHTFSATLNSAGTHDLSATDTATPTITGSQTGIVIRPAATDRLLVVGFASPSTAGVPSAFTVTAQDAFGNTTPAYTGRVTFSTSSTSRTLPGDYTFTAGDAGVRTFAATLNTAGTQTLTATDTVTATINGTQSGIVIDPAAASVLLVSGFPSPTTAGQAGAFSVEARDAFGNRATGYRGTVQFAATDLQATVPASSAFTAGDAGLKTGLSATFKTAGLQDLSATDTLDGALTGSQVAISVGSASTSQLLVAGYTSPSVAGTSRAFTVTARDGFGNTTPAYAGTVAFTTSSTNRTLPASYTFVPATDSGVHAFTASLNTAGTQSLTATDTVTGTITGQQTGIVITPAPASVLVVDSFPSPVTAGVAGSIRVTAHDGFGNTATGYQGTIAFTSSSANRTLPANYTFTAGDAGVRLFASGVTLRTAGTQSVTATDTVTGTITGAQTGIVVNPAAAATLVVSGFPSPTTAGAPARSRSRPSTPSVTAPPATSAA